MLLDILRGNSHCFAVRGGHATLAQVESPSWLPKEIIGKVLDKFKENLLSEITKMTEKRLRRRNRRHQRRGSGQSPNVSDSGSPRPSFDSLFSENESDDD